MSRPASRGVISNPRGCAAFAAPLAEVALSTFKCLRNPGSRTPSLSRSLPCVVRDASLSTLEATQGQILGQYPTDATWHLHGVDLKNYRFAPGLPLGRVPCVDEHLQQSGHGHFDSTRSEPRVAKVDRATLAAGSLAATTAHPCAAAERRSHPRMPIHSLAAGAWAPI